MEALREPVLFINEAGTVTVTGNTIEENTVIGASLRSMAQMGLVSRHSLQGK